MTRVARLGWWLLVSLVGCGSGSGGPPTTTPDHAHVTPDLQSPAGTAPAQASTLVLATQPFGGERYGFVEATSANGRYVALRRFAGTDEPQFGHHGEVEGGAELVLVDLTDASERPLAEIIDVTPSRRFFLLLEHDAPVLLNTETGTSTALLDADARSDTNTCLEPRQASFSPLGGRVGWVIDNGTGFRVRDLASDDEWSAHSSAAIWRGWPDDEGRGVVLAEIPAGSSGWPEQHTSCACRWCNRFAMSFGFYGWGGPTFSLVHVDANGIRTPSEAPESARTWRDTDDHGCTIAPLEGERGYSHGPWHRECP